MDVVSERLRRCFTAFDVCRKPFSGVHAAGSPSITTAGSSPVIRNGDPNGVFFHYSRKFQFEQEKNASPARGLRGLGSFPIRRIQSGMRISRSLGSPGFLGADNTIPMELALKIARKIKAKERFTVYVVIPMWPEGVPSSASVQEILYWQGQTMSMMYEIIAREIKSAELKNAQPTI